MSIDKLVTKTPSKKKIKENKKRIVRLLRNTQRSGVEELISWLDETDFYTAPASSRLDFHGCYEGGLAQHSLNVYELFTEKVERYGLEVGDDEAVISAICHDLCKVDQYVPNMIKGKGKNAKPVRSSAKPYKIVEEVPCGHGDKSVMLATRRIELSNNEIIFMRWHMGSFDPAYDIVKDKVQKEYPGMLAFQNADYEASKYLD